MPSDCELARLSVGITRSEHPERTHNGGRYTRRQPDTHAWSAGNGLFPTLNSLQNPRQPPHNRRALHNLCRGGWAFNLGGGGGGALARTPPQKKLTGSIDGPPQNPTETDPRAPEVTPTPKFGKK